MTRTQIQECLLSLGFKSLCDDNKTLVAYNQIQYMLNSNHTPMKEIRIIYVDLDLQLRVVLKDDYDVEIAYNLKEENL